MANIVIVGGGNQAHALIGTLSGKNHSVSILTRKAKEIEQKLKDYNGIAIFHAAKNVTQFAKPDKVTDAAKEIIPHADIILITNPANDRERVLKQIKPHLSKNKRVFVGAIPGWGGFHWLVEKELGNEKNIITWGLKDTPVMASHLNPGVSVTQLGEKNTLYFAINKPSTDKIEHTKYILQTIFDAELAYCENFLEFSLCAGNPIEHLPILYGKIGPYSQWDGTPFSQQPLFYEDISELEAYFVKRADEEQQKLVKTIRNSYQMKMDNAIPLQEDIIKIYGDQVKDKSTLYKTIKTNTAYKSIKMPMKKGEQGYELDFDHRIFSEDIPFGLDILIEIGKILAIETPFLTELKRWLSTIGANYPRSALDYIPEKAIY
ncbi:NAD/NADP-dependent octopine/nopaline dehydrogenase family protein [Marinobacter nanhaiticus D15-8W]|uniref:Uncharacterized protein n=1 Tax=Marinobacter nanhaiticus D15-8W TaxID=626887 RepID=N6WV49_9GAMM|nr:NAD/NADP-dependent octopine/nopaline dehydrogenase family protein [Marinobacter nanhaiticus]ENO12693.1 hypothetical protein J057_14865 [Marinobacter nanhaiticus D15-8W]BES70031.1 NAD/NADP-dependent octopine/nopaline dehydrogenase family protein [Marinobacter nanhaiticus D15-8W]